MTPGGRKRILLLGLALALLGLVIYSGAVVPLQGLLQRVLSEVARLGLWGQLAFVLIYIAATVLLIPGSALGLGAGALFGVVRGSLLVSIASTVGATCAFLLGRYLARGWVSRKIEHNTAFAAIDRAVAGEGMKIVFLTRLSPVFPFTLLNYAFGLTRVRLRDYVLASWVGMIPGTVMYVYLGSLARTGAADAPRTPTHWILYGVGLVATVAVTVIITRIARRALARSTTGVPRAHEP